MKVEESVLEPQREILPRHVRALKFRTSSICRLRLAQKVLVIARKESIEGWRPAAVEGRSTFTCQSLRPQIISPHFWQGNRCASTYEGLWVGHLVEVWDSGGRLLQALLWC